MRELLCLYPIALSILKQAICLAPDGSRGLRCEPHMLAFMQFAFWTSCILCRAMYIAGLLGEKTFGSNLFDSKFDFVALQVAWWSLWTALILHFLSAAIHSNFEFEGEFERVNLLVPDLDLIYIEFILNLFWAIQRPLVGEHLVPEFHRSTRRFPDWSHRVLGNLKLFYYFKYLACFMSNKP